MINGPCSIAKLLQQQEGILAAVFSVVLLVRMILNLDRWLFFYGDIRALFFFEGTLTNDNWDITIDIPEISNLNGNVSQIFQGVFADGSKPFKTYQSLRVEGMNIQRYTSYSGVKTRVIAYLKCRSLVCSSHIDFRLCRQNNHISMYNTYI